MHKTLFSALVLATLSQLAAAAQTPAGKAAPARAPAAVDVDTRIDTAMDAARTKVLAGDLDQAAHAELVNALKAGYSALGSYTPTTDLARTRLVTAVDDIYVRAGKTKLLPEEFDILRAESLDSRLSNSIAVAIVDPKPEMIKSITAHLDKLVDASKALDPEMVGMRTRAQGYVDALQKSAKPSPADFAPLMLETSAGGATRSVAILERRGVAKTVTAMDFTRVRNHIMDHFTLLGKSDASARETQTKLVAIVDGLEKKSASAALTPADFSELKSQLAAHARAASSKK